MTETIVKVMWVHIVDKKLLCVRSHGNDTFYTPGGKPEEGESDEQALIRELKEEISIDIVPESITHLKTFHGKAHGKHEGKNLEMRCFTADYSGTISPSSEIEEIAYMTSALELPYTSMGKTIIEWLYAEKYIN
jgi:8-oxo-dGTP pyrophosphatase MutT (NUDIX family)